MFKAAAHVNVDSGRPGPEVLVEDDVVCCRFSSTQTKAAMSHTQHTYRTSAYCNQVQLLDSQAKLCSIVEQFIMFIDNEQVMTGVKTTTRTVTNAITNM